MNISQAGIELIKKFEGCKLEAYLCPAGIPTIGVGHTGKDVRLGMTITEEEADRLLRSDLDRFERAVNQYVGQPITQGQFDALVSFAFNLGSEALRNSTLLRKLNDGDDVGASDEFGRWTKAGGRVLPGLVARREAEREMFLS